VGGTELLGEGPCPVEVARPHGVDRGTGVAGYVTGEGPGDPAGPDDAPPQGRGIHGVGQVHTGGEGGQSVGQGGQGGVHPR